MTNPVTNPESTSAANNPSCPGAILFDGTVGSICFPIHARTIVSKPRYYLPGIKKVIFNEESGVTVLLWEDNQRTIVRLGEGETFDRYNGFMAAICKRLFGGTSTAKKLMNAKDEMLIKQKAQAEKEKTRKENLKKMEEDLRRKEARKEKTVLEVAELEIRVKKAIQKICSKTDDAFLKSLANDIADEITENLENGSENRGE